MTGVHRSEAWLQAQLQRTGKQIAEGAVQAMERDLAEPNGGVAKQVRHQPLKLQTAGSIPASPAKLLPTEHQIQAAFIQWCKLNETRLPALKLAFAVPNAAKRSMALAQIMRAEGLRAGVPDWWLPVPRKQFTGLVIEFKAPGKKPTVAQAAYMDLLIAENWLVYDDMSSVEQAIFSVEYYLS